MKPEARNMVYGTPPARMAASAASLARMEGTQA